MSSPASAPKGIAQLADDLLAYARQESREGFKADDTVRIRGAAEKAWNAAVQATDLAVRARGTPPTPGPRAHGDRHVFFERIGLGDLQTRYSFFADLLHGGCFYEGRTPPEETMNRWLDEVGQYNDDIKAGI